MSLFEEEISLEKQIVIKNCNKQNINTKKRLLKDNNIVQHKKEKSIKKFNEQKSNKKNLQTISLCKVRISLGNKKLI